ncbi:MAG: ATP-binding cassette domain-containing protein [Bacteroidetes bacterium]|nr:ATP-binding cassette domain-containing protein [Bacteroidota bacterium]
MAKIKAKPGDELPKAKLNIENLKKTLRIFKYIGKHKWKFFLGMFFLAGTAATALIFPRLMGDLMGVIGGSGPQKEISRDELIDFANNTGIKLLVLFALQAVFSFFRVVTFTSVTENMLASMRQAAYNKLIQMPMTFFSQRQVAELNSRIATDITQISDTFTTNIAEFLRQLIIIVGGIIIICFMSWKMAVVMLAIIPVIAILTLFFAKYIRRLSKEAQDKVAESNVIVGESLQGIANVKSFTNESYEINRYKNKVNEIKQIAIKGGIARGSFFSFIIFCLFGAIIFIVWYGIQLTLEGVISATDMISFLMYTVFVAASIGGIADQLAAIQRTIGATERVMDIIDGTPEKINLTANKSTERVKGDISFDNISFFYDTRPDFQVLHNISFKANKGETVALVGPSGSGKSTIASIVLRFYDPKSGTVSIDGKDASEYDLTELRENMAIVPQDVLLFGGSIKENIEYGKPGASMQEIIEAARKANALEFIDSFPQQFETVVGDRGIQLSGGQRQRIAIARAVLKDPSILILDEATSSLDSESERLVQEALDQLMIGRTSIVIAHRLSTIRKADKIIVIEKGVVKETGKHEELMQIENGLYRSLNRMQMELA